MKFPRIRAYVELKLLWIRITSTNKYLFYLKRFYMYYYDVNTKNIHVPHQFGLLPRRDYKLLFVNYFKLSKVDFQKIFGSTQMPCLLQKKIRGVSPINIF